MRSGLCKPNKFQTTSCRPSESTVTLEECKTCIQGRRENLPEPASLANEQDRSRSASQKVNSISSGREGWESRGREQARDT